MEESWDDIIAEAGDGFNRPPEGEYDFLIEEAESKVSKSGNPMIRVKAKITGGPQHGKAIKDFYVIRSKSQAEKFMLHMRAVGITIDTLRDLKPTMAQLAKALEGKPFRGKVKHKSDDDFGDSAELAWTMKPPTGGAVAVTEFAAVSEAEALGYGSGEAPAAATDDAAF
jgi:hypothetical protein